MWNFPFTVFCPSLFLSNIYKMTKSINGQCFNLSSVSTLEALFYNILFVGLLIYFLLLLDF